MKVTEGIFLMKLVIPLDLRLLRGSVTVAPFNLIICKIMLFNAYLYEI